MREWMILLFPMMGPLLSANAALPASSSPAVERSDQETIGASSNELANSLQKANDLITSGQINDALDVLDEVDKKEANLPETNFLYGKAYVLKAEKMIKEGASGMNIGWSFSDATKYLEKATSQSPKNGEAFLLLGRARLGESNLAGAAEAAAQASSLMPKSHEALFLKGEIAFQRYLQAREENDSEQTQSQEKLAKDSLSAAIKLSPNFGPAWLKQGDLLAWGGKKEEAMDTYAHAMGLDPQETTAKRVLNSFEMPFWSKIFEKALTYSKDAAGGDEKASALLHWYLGYSKFQMKDYEGAKQAFQKSVALNPEFLTSYYYLGKILYELKDYMGSADAFAQYGKKDAEALARIIAEEPPESQQRTLAILNYLEPESFNKGKADAAREIAHLNALLEPKKAERWNNYGFLCRETGKYEESYQAYSAAVELDPDNPRLLNDCALILQYHLYRDLDQAKTMYEKAVEKAKAILADPKAGAKTKEDARVALQDASDNLAKLRLHPDGEKTKSD